jgi:hypothetical protein
MAREGCEHVRVSSLTREEIEAAVRAAWARDTCDPVDVADWSAANPGRGQCGTTALTINDLLGGELLLAEVLRADGSRQGVHWWNRLPDGTEMDLTREQFASYEVIQQPRVVPRPSGLPKRAAEQYLTLRHRVLHALGLTGVPTLPETNDEYVARLDRGTVQPQARRHDEPHIAHDG